MSKTHTVRKMWLTLVVLSILTNLVISPAIWAQISPLDRFKGKNQLKAQKLEQEVSHALKKVRKLERTKPDEALQILQVYKAILENDTTLTKSRRVSLLSYINGRLQEVQRTAKLTDSVTAQKSKTVSTQQKQFEKYAASNPGAKSTFEQMKKSNDFFKSRVAQNNQVKAQKEGAFRLALLDVDKAAVPITGDVTFPKYWKQLSETRKLFTGPKLTKKEQELLKALNSVMSVEFDHTPFDKVIEYLQETTKQIIVLDGPSIREVGLIYDTPITFKSPGKVTFRTVLKKVLGDVGLAYILKDGTIQVVSPQKARDSLVVRAYPISDLVPTDPRFGPNYNRALGNHYAARLAQMIQTTVEPGSWQANGGRGTIGYDPVSRSLIISNSAEMHYSLSSGFGR